MRELKPHSRNMKGIHVRRKPAVRVIDVVADFLGVLHGVFRRAFRRHLQIFGAILTLLVGLSENTIVAISARRTVLLFDDSLHRLVHGLHIGPVSYTHLTLPT